MSKLNDLIKSLKAYTIIIIEDEITYIDDPIKLLIEFCLSEDRVKKSIIEELDTHQREYNKAKSSSDLTYWPRAINNGVLLKTGVRVSEITLNNKGLDIRT